MIESTYHGHGGTSSGTPVFVENERLAPHASLLELRCEIATVNRVDGINHCCTCEDWNNLLRNKRTL